MIMHDRGTDGDIIEELSGGPSRTVSSSVSTVAVKALNRQPQKSLSKSILMTQWIKYA